MGRQSLAGYASHLLGRDVADWILDRRADGRSWRQIVADLEEATGGQIHVTPETLRRWALGNLQDVA